MRQSVWTVGEIARRTGVSVRALHHYDEIGLLSPATRSDAGYRLYGAEDIAGLLRIRTMRQLGFSLAEIRDLIERRDFSPRRIIKLQLLALEERMAAERALHERLEWLLQRLSLTSGVEAEDFLHTMEVMNMVEHVDKYYTPEQRAQLREREQLVGPERIREVESEWPDLIAQVRAEMVHGTHPKDERVQVLARRWQSLINEFTGGDPEIIASLQRMYKNEPEMRQQSGVEPALEEYIGKAVAQIKTGE